MADRLFHYIDSTSSKFWRITLHGKNHTVQWGRLGTAGQLQTKYFDSDADAQRSHDKLIQEKVGKGYVEVTEGGAPAPVAAPPAPRATAKKEAAAPAPPEPPPPPPAEIRAATIDLEPAEWRWATWRALPPLPKPAAAPFDRQEAIARFKRIRQHAWNFQWDWARAGIPIALSPEEALFWFWAMVELRYPATPQKLAPALASTSEKPLAFDEVPELLRRQGTLAVEEIVIPLVHLFGVEPLIDLLLEATPRSGFASEAHFPASMLAEGVRRYVVPYLNATERAAVERKVREAFPPPSQWPTNQYATAHAAFHLGAALGLHDEVRAVVESWPDDLYTGEPWVTHYHRPQEMVFGLGSAREVEAHMRRLKLKLESPAHIRAWLAHTETSALDYARDTILATTQKEEAERLVQALAIAHAPETAAVMLELMLSPRTAKRAVEWLHENPDLAVAGLLPIAAGRGATAQAATDFLRSLKRRGLEPLMRKAAESLDPELRERVRASVLDHAEKVFTEFDPETTPAWLRDALGNVAPPKKTAAWVSADDLPPITAGDFQLNAEQIARVLDALRASTVDAPHPLTVALRANADRDALDRFAWRLFELWLMNGAVAKENWALIAVGLLGGDASALRLTPMIRVWPGESQHQRAVTGLECLRAIGTDTALMQINGIAQKLKFKGLKAKAAECMEKIAADRGLTRSQLEDRIVPDCDLDERGSRVFDFGPRQFTFVLGPDMKALVRDDGGKAKPDLPKPGAKDDPEKSAAAVAAWKLLRKQIAEVAKIQAVRLEQAMVTGRRWTVDEFELLLLKHPLMTNLARLLVWAVYDGGEVKATFRVTEDQTLADSKDRAFTPPPHAVVGIVHPLQLPDAEKNAWGEVLSDYEIIPPFPQLGRPVHALEAAERQQKDITRFAKKKLPPQTLVFGLEKLGWERGIPQDGGAFSEHSKPFYGAGVTAVVQYEGVPVGYMEGWDDQSIDECFFVPGIYTPSMYPTHANALPLKSVDPIVISEVLSDLIQLMAKAK